MKATKPISQVLNTLVIIIALPLVVLTGVQDPEHGNHYHTIHDTIIKIKRGNK